MTEGNKVPAKIYRQVQETSTLQKIQRKQDIIVLVLVLEQMNVAAIITIMIMMVIIVTY